MFNGTSGGTRVAATYAEQLRRRGHEVCVVSTPGRRVGMGQCLRAGLTGRGWPQRRRRASGYFDLVDVEHRVLDRVRPLRDADVPDADAVVAFWWETAAWVAGLSPRKGAKAYFMQDYGVPGQGLEQIVPTWSLPLHLITISRWLADLIHEHVDKAVDVIPNAVDTSIFQAPPRSKQRVPTIGFVYNPAWSKGADLCIAAAERARQAVPDLQIITFGKPATEALKLPDWVVHHGRVAEARLRELYAACDAWLFGSRLEGFGLPMLEAMACRTPVLATTAGAAPELLAEGGGRLVRPMHPDAMGTAIEWVAGLSSAAWEEMSAAAYRTAARYTWDDATTLFENALQRAGESQKETDRSRMLRPAAAPVSR